MSKVMIKHEDRSDYMNKHCKNIISLLTPLTLIFEPILNKFLDNNCIILAMHLYPDAEDNFNDAIIRKNIMFLKNNCNVVSLNELFDLLYNHQDIPNRTIAITIDDAKQSFYMHGYPILKEFDLPFTLAVIPGLIKSNTKEHLVSKVMRIAGHTFYLDHKKMINRAADWFELKGLKRANSFEDVFQEINSLSNESTEELIKYLKIPEDDFISWDVLKEMQLNKNVSFASHTMSHMLLRFSRNDWLHWELAESKSLLEKNLNINVDTFILPYGKSENYSLELENELMNLGYKYALYTKRGAVSLNTAKLKIPRMNGEVNTNLFRVFTSGSICRAIFGTRF